MAVEANSAEAEEAVVVTPHRRPRVLVAHERSGIGEAVRRVLTVYGFEVECVTDGDDVDQKLRAEQWDALVLDVAMPGTPSYELCALAKDGVTPPILAVVLVATVFRRSSYKRRPTRLYGADDYVEIYRLGEQLPGKLWRLLGSDLIGPPGEAQSEAVMWSMLEDDFAEDARPEAPERIADLLVADLVLSNADRVLNASSIEQARLGLEGDLSEARMRHAQAVGEEAGEAVDLAFHRLMAGFGLASQEHG